MSAKNDNRVVPDIDPTELSAEIRKYQSTGVVSLNLSYLMRNIAKKMAMSRKWRSFPQDMLDDMESEAFYWMVRWALKTVKPDQKCFSYLMCAANSAFCRYLQNHERNEKCKDAMRKLLHDEGVCELYADFETDEDGEY